MTRLGLTPVQSRLYRFIRDNSPGGICPTYDQMAAGIGLASKSTIGHLLSDLATRGWISWSPQINRSARALESPDPYHIDRLAALHPAKFEKLALDIVTLQARRAAA